MVQVAVFNATGVSASYGKVRDAGGARRLGIVVVHIRVRVGGRVGRRKGPMRQRTSRGRGGWVGGRGGICTRGERRWGLGA